MCHEKAKTTNKKALSIFGTKSAAASHHEDGKDDKDLESTARKMNFWRAWWRKRRSSNDRPPRPASQLVAYACINCGEIFFSFEPRAVCRKCYRHS
jgi:hypothetical protein